MILGHNYFMGVQSSIIMGGVPPSPPLYIYFSVKPLSTACLKGKGRIDEAPMKAPEL